MVAPRSLGGERQMLTCRLCPLGSQLLGKERRRCEEAMAFTFPGTEEEMRNQPACPSEGLLCWGECGGGLWCSLAVVLSKAPIFLGLCFLFRRHCLYGLCLL